MVWRRLQIVYGVHVTREWIIEQCGNLFMKELQITEKQHESGYFLTNKPNVFADSDSNLYFYIDYRDTPEYRNDPKTQGLEPYVQIATKDSMLPNLYEDVFYEEDGGYEDFLALCPESAWYKPVLDNLYNWACCQDENGGVIGVYIGDLEIFEPKPIPKPTEEQVQKVKELMETYGLQKPEPDTYCIPNDCSSCS